ncbi:MAG TPA: hypothetical protein VFB71_02920 [Ramlibacter sp.]|nr:hypothetical protein [Ramlibacter sp.]
MADRPFRLFPVYRLLRVPPLIWGMFFLLILVLTLCHAGGARG